MVQAYEWLMRANSQLGEKITLRYINARCWRDAKTKRQMNEKTEDELDKTAPLSGSIFAVTSDEVGAKTHWKRRSVIRIYPFALLLVDIILLAGVFVLLMDLHAYYMLGQDIGFFNSVSRRY
ncbi:hypothetical protein [Rubritalea tangerina]|uniref:hypothetical protein n=1 Tax=Rubritalea tangerina TaxID=430798 RepID=UPI0036096036